MPPLAARLAALLFFALAALPEPSAAAPGSSPADAPRPNVLILMAEDLSPRIGSFGDPVAVTPNLDRLAAEGTRFPNTFTTAGVCAPSRAAHITGVHQVVLGAQHMRSREGGYLAVPAPEVKAYPELLRAADYWTFTNSKLDYQFSSVFAGSGPFTIWDEEGRGTDWSGRPPGKRFYGLVTFDVTHESAVFPRGVWPRSVVHLVFQALYLWRFWGHEDVVAPSQVTVPPYYPDTELVRADLARHYNNIHLMDQQVGAMLQQLEADGLAESTVVVWTTDHGDGLPRAKRELYDSGIRVPMIVRWPEALRPADAVPGGVDEQLVSFVDFAPTVLALAGAPAPDYLAGRVFAGPSARGPERRFVYAAADRVDEVTDRRRAVRDTSFKYIRNYERGPGARHLAFRDNQDLMRELWRLEGEGALSPEAARWFAPRPAEELYALSEDPDELVDLAADSAHGATLARLREALDAWLVRDDDLSELPEAEMAEQFWPGGVQPVTATPALQPGPDGVQAFCATEGASLGYAIGGGKWQLYTGPVPVEPGAEIEVKAVRYGWAESEVATLRVD